MKSVFKAVAIAAIMGGSAFAFTPAASAAENNHCTAQRFCLYVDSNWKGTRAVYAPTGSCVVLSGAIRGEASAMGNDSSYHVFLYKSTNCTGGYNYDAKPNSSDSTFNNNGINDAIFSLKFVS